MVVGFVEKLLLFLQLNFPVIGGTILHMAILKKKGNHEASILGWIILIVISIFTGLMFEFVAIAYYEWNELPKKEGVIRAALFIGGAIGFGGLMWISTKVQSAADLVLKKYLSSDNSKRDRQYEDMYNYPTDEYRRDERRNPSEDEREL